MSFSAIQRDELIVPFVVFANDLPAARTETAAEVLAVVAPPTNCTVVGLNVSFAVGTGTTKSATVTILRVGGAVLGTAAASVDATPVRTALSISFARGEAIQINIASGHTDNVFEGLLVWLDIQVVPDA